jgi:mRNA interferase MazF
MQKGDIVLIPFPFTDLSGNKLRPAVILHANDFDITVCFITSQLKWKESSDIAIEPSKINGIKVPSLIRISKIATLDKNLALGKLGELSEEHLSVLNHNLKKLFGLF